MCNFCSAFCFNPWVSNKRPSKNDKSIKFDQIKLILRAFLVFCGPQQLFSYTLWSAEHFFSRMWPSNQFEFETPVLTRPNIYILRFFLLLVTRSIVISMFHHISNMLRPNYYRPYILGLTMGPRLFSFKPSFLDCLPTSHHIQTAHLSP
jgi:hypothetical protein